MNSDQTHLAGVAVNGLLKQAGIKFGVKFANELIKKIPGVGAAIGGGLDLVETKVIADRAYKWFIKGDFSVKSEKEEDLIEIDDIDFDV